MSHGENEEVFSRHHKIVKSDIFLNLSTIIYKISLLDIHNKNKIK